MILPWQKINPGFRTALLENWMTSEKFYNTYDSNS